MSLTEIKKNINRYISDIFIFSFLIGLLVPVISIIIYYFRLKATGESLGLAQAHLKNPVLFITELIPFLIAFTADYIHKYFVRLEAKYQDEIYKKDDIISSNAEFAEHIGRGDFDSAMEFSTYDMLGRSLLVMRDNLVENYTKEAEENWISEGKEQLSNILRIHNNLEELSYEVLKNLIEYIEVTQGSIFLYEEDREKLVNYATYAYNRRRFINQEFKIGEGLIGECAFEQEYIYRTEIPEEYVTISSGLINDKKPSNILLVPLISDDKLQGIMEFAAIDEISKLKQTYVIELSEIIARTIFNLRVNKRTEQLLQEAQNMTIELKQNEEKLKQNAEEMKATQEELEESNNKLEKQIREVENARKRLNSLLENASEIITIYDDSQRMKYISPSVIKIMGYTTDEMMRGKDIERLTKKGEIEFKNMLSSLIDNPKEAITIQYTYLKKDGKKIFLETTGRNLLNDPAIEGIILNTQDITARKKAEKEERMRSRMQSLSENSLDMIIRLSLNFQCFYANPIVKDYLGLSPNEMIDKKLNDLSIMSEFKDYLDELIEEMKENPNKNNKQITLPLEIGEKRTERIMNFDAIPEFSENENELETILLVGHDITEAKRIEKEIQQKNKNIQDSINYAQRIQNSILPNNDHLRETFPKSFIFYEPRDVVSGDFPWFHKKDDISYIAAVDCTGHGVPGALLSFVGYFTLNNITDHGESLNSGQILDILHSNVRATLNQERPDATQRDGMDIAFCKIDNKNMKLEYAGAHRPLYLLRDGEITEYKGNRKAIGGIPLAKKTEKDFINYEIGLKPKDRIYFFSDGLPDQVNSYLKKYSAKRMREHILNNVNNPINEQHELFKKDFLQHKGNYKQTDDVLVIGIEF